MTTLMPSRYQPLWEEESSYDRADRCRRFLLMCGLLTIEQDRAIRRRMDRIAVKRYRLGKRFKSTPEASPATETTPDSVSPAIPRLDGAGEF